MSLSVNPSYWFFGSFSHVLSGRVCDSNVKAKHTILPFPYGSINALDSFDLIHYNICGNYHIPFL